MEKKTKFSVLLSVYFKEKRENLKLALKSIYEDQILKPNEIVLVEDGPLSEELYSEIDYQLENLNGILKIVKLEKNSGLGNALKEGVLHCNYEWIARMDTDDISYPERFLKQVKFIENNPNVDVLGTFMTEFIDDRNNKICVKDAPLERIENSPMEEIIVTDSIPHNLEGTKKIHVLSCAKLFADVMHSVHQHVSISDKFIM